MSKVKLKLFYAKVLSDLNDTSFMRRIKQKMALG